MLVVRTFGAAALIFFSYARKDWKAAAQYLSTAVDQLESSAQAESGLPIDIYRDAKRLEIGDDWRETLMEEIDRRPIFVVLLSANWLTSAVCQEEYQRFLEAHAADARCIATLLWRAPQDVDDAAAKRFAELKRWQCADWTGFRRLSEDDRYNEAAEQGEAIGRKARSLGKPPSAEPPKHHAPPPSGSPRRRAVQGGFSLSGQGGEALVRLIVADSFQVEHPDFDIRLGTRRLVLEAEVTGGRIRPETERFTDGREAPPQVRTCRTTASGEDERRFYALQVSAKQGRLPGQPLNGPGEAGAIHIFSAEAEEGVRPEITGGVEIDVDDVEVLRCRSRDTGEDENAALMREKIVQRALQLRGVRHRLRGSEDEE